MPQPREPLPPEPPDGTRAVPPDAPAISRPTALVAACVLVLVQSAALIGLGAAWAADLVRGNAQSPGATAFLVLFALGVAAVLIAGARGLWLGRRWARSPVITWQLLLAVMAIGWLRAEASVWVIGLLVSAAAVVVALLLPAVVAATSERPPRTAGGSPML